ncbi:membrane protein insertion efficiency factor YidD [Candidatus Clavichlamydia salmonicola]|uniref:membrane protein insertion efficiency factor YidD n=1 Tax=Candidatus Clavichlamydia salmonicola TaxID=469812 RepID=UPI001891EF0F|nr:membrane protein insertion efficiency factor YidD [Candidatus Clavichlamydia salmonicola]
MQKFLQTLAIFFVRFYQIGLKLFLPLGSCRFHPSCSRYSIQSFEMHGFIKGCFLTLKRLIKCGPWHPGGFDPVSPKVSKSSLQVEVFLKIDD